MTWIRWIFITIFVLGVGVAGLWVWMRSSLPVIDGRMAVSGLTAPVEIMRTRHGVPHIYAQSKHDAYFALGFTHAQDRLWQMEINRRIAYGRLSEVLGSLTVGMDKFIRALGFGQEAEDIWQRLPPAQRALLEAYAAGVNHFLTSRDSALPPEFLLTAIEPEPWRPQDSIIWYKVMALDLAGNFSKELRRYRLFRHLTAPQVAEFYALEGGARLPELPSLAALGLPPPKPDPAAQIETAAKAPLDKALAQALLPGAFATPDAATESIGSNSWVLSGNRTVSGAPILANDPHLGLSAPSIWYLAHLSWPGQNIVGATFPGGPLVVLGRTDHLAWGFTNAETDVQDLFLEKLVAGQPDQYETPEGPAPFTERREKIRVRFADDIDLVVRQTRHGPVMSDHHSGMQKVTPDGYVMALAWTALSRPDLSIGAGLDLPQIQSIDRFSDMFAQFVGPQQNMIVADRQGNIGHFIPARVPRRHPDNPIQGYLPSPGWLALYDWQGYLETPDLPAWINPASGQLATANNRMVPIDHIPTFGFDFAAPYRIQRLQEALNTNQPISLDDTQQLQQDLISVRARERLPQLLAQLTEPSAEPARTVFGMLQRWDGDMHADRPEPLIFNLWMNRLNKAAYADEIGGNIQNQTRAQSLFIDRLIAGNHNAWCDDQTTPTETELCRTLIRRSFDDAVAALVQAHGADPYLWRWGLRHEAANSHRPFGQFPLLNTLFDIRLPSSGSTYTVNVGGHSIAADDDNFDNTHAPAFRAIYDLSDLDQSRFMISTGQSGNPFSRFYDDLARPWATGTYITIPTDRQTVSTSAIARLTLVPQPQ